MHTSGSPAQLRRRIACVLMLSAAVVLPPPSAAQSGAAHDSSSRMRRYTHNLGYGAALGFVWAGVDQLQDDPEDWTYGQRLASGVGEFVIQESVTDLLSWGMHRPLDYTYCHCNGFGRKLGWSMQSAFTDVLPNGRRTLAVPRIFGAYAGSFAQAAWMPTTSNRTQDALINGTVSLLIGGGINLYHELNAPKQEAVVADRRPGSNAGSKNPAAH